MAVNDGETETEAVEETVADADTVGEGLPEAVGEGVAVAER